MFSRGGFQGSESRQRELGPLVNSGLWAVGYRERDQRGQHEGAGGQQNRHFRPVAEHHRDNPAKQYGRGKLRQDDENVLDSHVETHAGWPG